MPFLSLTLKVTEFMDKWIDGQMDGRGKEEIGEWIQEGMDGQMDRQIGICMDSCFLSWVVTLT